MTVPVVVAAAFFGGNIDKTRRFLHEYAYMPTMISNSHLNGRIHAIEPSPWWALFSLLAEAFKKPSNNPEQTYVVDSLCPYQCVRQHPHPPLRALPCPGGLRRSVSRLHPQQTGLLTTVWGCIW
jgi:hypothetical protein